MESASSTQAALVDPRQGWWRTTAAIITAFVVAKLVLHFVTANGYGYFRDELYYIMCGERLDWGFVDHPPLAPLAARAGRTLFGEGLFAVRFFPAVAGAITIAITGLMARALGGGRFAIVLSCLSVLVTPVYLASQSKLATDSIEPPFWAACAYLLLRIIKEGDPKLWLWFGVFAGLGLQVKHSIVFFGLAVTVALLITPERRLLWSQWLLLGAFVAFLIALPNIAWQARNDWPTYELLRNIKNSDKNVVLGPGAYLAQQLLLIGPVNALIWISGLMALLVRREWRPFRVFSIAYLVLFAIMIVLKGKNYYLSPMYPVLLAAGAVVIERFSDDTRGLRPSNGSWNTRLRWIRPVLIVLLLVVGLYFAPFVLPVLPPEKFLAYQEKTGFKPPRTEKSHTASMPQNFADRFGWEELAANVAHSYHSLPEADRRRAGIFAQNYGEAGALDVLGRKYGLPPTLSGHQNYFFWGPRGYTGEVLIVLDDDPSSLQRFCDSVEEKEPALRHPYVMPYENEMNIYLCRGLKPSLPELWPRLKNWR